MNAGQVIFIQWTSLNNCALFDHINSDLPGLGAPVNDTEYLKATLSREKLLFTLSVAYIEGKLIGSRIKLPKMKCLKNSCKTLLGALMHFYLFLYK